LGILIAYVVGYFLVGVEYDWRIMFGLGSIPPLGLLVIALFFMWESQIWALKQVHAIISNR
jgi:MFS family permease